VTAPDGVVIPNAIHIGITGGEQVLGASLTDLRAAHEGFFPNLMGN